VLFACVRSLFYIIVVRLRDGQRRGGVDGGVTEYCFSFGDAVDF